MRKHVCAFAFGLFSLTSCSPYPYAGAVKSFADDTTTVGTFLDQSDNDARVALMENVRYRRKYIGPRPELRMSDACAGNVGDDGVCDEVVTSTGLPQFAFDGSRIDLNKAALNTIVELQEPAKDTYPCPPPLNGSVAPPSTEKAKKVTVARIQKVLQTYAKSLSAITNAADRAALDSAFTDLSKSVSAMASTVGLAGGPAVSAAAGAIAGPAVSVIGWITGTVEDRQRLDALTASLQVTCRPMQVLSVTVNTLITVRQQRIAAARRGSILAINHGRRAVSADEDEKRDILVNDLMSRGIQMPAADGSGPGAEMGKAHDALVKAVLNREGQTDELLKAIGAFSDAVAGLETAIKKSSGSSSASKS